MVIAKTADTAQTFSGLRRHMSAGSLEPDEKHVS